MIHKSNYVNWLSIIVLFTGMTASCKRNSSSKDKLNSIVGSDLGQKEALIVLPIDIINSKNLVNKKAKDLSIESQALVFIQCLGTGSENASEAAKRLELKANYNHAVINREGDIFLTNTQTGFLEKSSTCSKVEGSNFVSARSVFDFFSKSSNENKLIRQTIFLALRGSYKAGGDIYPTMTFKRFADMAAKEMGIKLNAAKIQEMFTSIDRKLNPCVNKSEYEFFTCVSDLNDAKLSNYRSTKSLKELRPLITQHFYKLKSKGMKSMGLEDVSTASEILKTETPPAQPYSPISAKEVANALNKDAGVYYASTTLPEAIDTRDEYFNTHGVETTSPNSQNFSTNYSKYQQQVTDRENYIKENSRNPENPLSAFTSSEPLVDDFWKNQSSGSGNFQNIGQTSDGLSVYRTVNKSTSNYSNTTTTPGEGYAFYDSNTSEVKTINNLGYVVGKTSDGRQSIRQYYSPYGNEFGGESTENYIADMQMQMNTPVIEMTTIKNKDGTIGNPQPRMVTNLSTDADLVGIESEVSADGRLIRPTEAGLEKLERCMANRGCGAEQINSTKEIFKQGVINPGLLPTVK